MKYPVSCINSKHPVSLCLQIKNKMAPPAPNKTDGVTLRTFKGVQADVPAGVTVHLPGGVREERPGSPSVAFSPPGSARRQRRF